MTCVTRMGWGEARPLGAGITTGRGRLKPGPTQEGPGRALSRPGRGRLETGLLRKSTEAIDVGAPT